MKTLNIVFDDDTAKVLAKYPNKSQMVRDAVKLYDNDVTTETKEGILAMFRIIIKRLDELETPAITISSEPTIDYGVSQDPADRPRDLGEVLRENGVRPATQKF